MTVQELINELKKHDPAKQVMIQQGEDFDYMAVYSVKEKELFSEEEINNDGILKAVVIEYS
jgi:hypothetical protein